MRKGWPKGTHSINTIHGETMARFEKLKEAILEEARAQAGDILSQGDLEAKDILSQAQGEADRTRSRGEAAALRKSEEMKEHLFVSARREQETRVLETKYRETQMVFDELARTLQEMPISEYQTFLARLVQWADLPSGDYEILVSEHDSQRLDPSFLSGLGDLLTAKGIRLEYKGGTTRIKGGLVLKGKEMEENLSIESLLRMHREELVSLVMGSLFSEAGPGRQEES